MGFRPTPLAGRWYPADAGECRRFLDTVVVPPVNVAPARGAIVPHAGWTYSGDLAFGALKAVQASAPGADLIVLFGGHLARTHEPRLFVDTGFSTPLGTIRCAEALAQDVAMAIESMDLESADDFHEENGVEVLLPMVKHLWPDTPLLAVGPPPNTKALAIGKEVVELARRAGYKSPVLIGSTDLTHYGPDFNFQPKGSGDKGLAWVKEVNDPAIITPMRALDAAQVIWVADRERNACCAGSAAAAISGAKVLGAKRGQLTAYATSHDMNPTGTPASFVGYASLVLG